MALLSVDLGPEAQPITSWDLHAGRLERGDILFFPRIPFAFPVEDQAFLLGIRQIESSHHKNIAYRPNQDRVSNFTKKAADQERLRTVLRDFSTNVRRFISVFLPPYVTGWRLDYASFRPMEEQGRELSLRSRNDLLHTDAFPTRPTNGDMILRFFVNINPNEARVWDTGEPFAKVIEHFWRPGGFDRQVDRMVAVSQSPVGRLCRIGKKAGQTLGLKTPDRSPYDQTMLALHHAMKEDNAFQRDAARMRSEFPSGSAWMVFTDVVPHAVVSGRFALEQTFIISRDTLAGPENAPASILEKLSGKTLTYGRARDGAARAT